MEGFDKFISYGDAINIFDSMNWKYPGKENININSSLNRISYGNVYSDQDIPEFNKSAVDGYALKSSDIINAAINNPAMLKVIGSSEAGEKFLVKIKENQCIEVYTGSEIPDGADAVVKVEDTEKHGDYIYVYSSLKHDNIFKKGEDIAKGYKILEKNERILPQHIAAMASVRIDNITVYKKIKIGIISTGNELLNPGDPYIDGKIYESNSIAIKAELSKYSAFSVKNYGIIKDDYSEIKNIIDMSLSREIGETLNKVEGDFKRQ
jgi:molybdopterin biosynthesis enzyme